MRERERGKTPVGFLHFGWYVCKFTVEASAVFCKISTLLVGIACAVHRHKVVFVLHAAPPNGRGMNSKDLVIRAMGAMVFPLLQPVYGREYTLISNLGLDSTFKKRKKK
jgi:hypothetical protein